MFPLLSFLLSLVGLVTSTYTDLKERIIPDQIPYGMVVLGVVLSAYESFQTQSIIPLAFTIGITLLTYCVAYLFWRGGAWAGGDVKLFTGLAALNPFNPFIGSLLGLSFTWGGVELLIASRLPIFMLNLFILSVFMLFPYTGLLSVQSLFDKKKRKVFVQSTVSAAGKAILYALIIVLFNHVAQFYNVSFIFVLAALLITAFLPASVRNVISLLSLVGIAAGIVSFSTALSAVIGLVLVNVFLSWYGFAKENALTYTKPISALEDGDIPGELIIRRGEKVFREPTPSFKTIIKAGFRKDIGMVMSVFSPTGEILANPRQAAGVYPEQIAVLQDAVKNGLLSDELKVKASTPFAPAVLLAYVVLSLLGDGPIAWWFG